MKTKKQLESKDVVVCATEIFQKAIEELYNPLPSIKFGAFSQFNDIIGGLRPKEFTILCGPTGSGKTALLASWSTDLIRMGVNHFVASVETGPIDYVQRTLAILENKDFLGGEGYTKEEMVEVMNRQASMYLKRNLYLSLYENRFSVESLMRDILYAREEKGCRVAFVDNLNFFLKPTSAANSIVEMDRVVHELIMFCKQTDIHIVMIMHPKKTDGGRVESEFDIKGSSTAVQEAQNVLLFNRLSDKMIMSHKELNYRSRELKYQKSRRRGKNVGKRMYLGFMESGYKEINVHV